MIEFNRYKHSGFLIGALLMLPGLLLSSPGLSNPVTDEPVHTEPEILYGIEGRAYAIDGSHQLLYIERYTPLDDNNQLQVDYFTPHNLRFAYKTLDYSTGLYTPSYRLHDTRDNSENGATVGDTDIVLFDGTVGKTKQTRITPQQRQVVDAGFTSMVRDNWDSLQQGKTVDIHFAFATRQRNIKLALASVDGSRTPVYERGAEWSYFTMTVSNRLLAMFVDTIYLAFDTDKKLMRYHGRSNLVDDQGKSQDVVINYQYLQE